MKESLEVKCISCEGVIQPDAKGVKQIRSGHISYDSGYPEFLPHEDIGCVCPDCEVTDINQKVIHKGLLGYNRTACGLLKGSGIIWSNVWDRDLKVVNCPECLKEKGKSDYTITRSLEGKDPKVFSGCVFVDPGYDTQVISRETRDPNE